MIILTVNYYITPIIKYIIINGDFATRQMSCVTVPQLIDLFLVKMHLIFLFYLLIDKSI